MVYYDDEPTRDTGGGEIDPYDVPQRASVPIGPPVGWGSLNPPQNVPGGWSDEHTGGFVPANSGNQSGYMDMSYWASRGVPADQIFDLATGQIKPGWTRTGKGYERSAPAGAVATGGGGSDPYVYGSYGGGGGFGGADLSAIGGGGPDYSMLPFSPYDDMPGFAPPVFTPSSWADAENEPGYKPSRAELRKQIEAGAAYKGMVRSGMTIGDLYSNLDALSQQNFKQFDDRRFRNFQSDYTGARDKYSFGATENARKNTDRYNKEKASFDDALSRWEEQVRSLTALAQPVE